MSLLLSCITIAIVLNMVTVESQWCEGKYTMIAEVEGHCFFEPPKATYQNEINAKSTVGGSYWFNRAAADAVCKSYDNAYVVRWDTNLCNDVTRAIVKLAKSMDKGPVFVPCYEVEDEYDKCYGITEKGNAGVEAWYFLEPKGRHHQHGDYYTKDEFVALICHHLPKPGWDTTTTEATTTEATTAEATTAEATTEEATTKSPSTTGDGSRPQMATFTVFAMAIKNY